MKIVRWGVLGYARIAREWLLPAIAGAPGSQLVAIASRDAAKLKEAAARFPAPHQHASYEALLQDPEVDAVYLPLPNSLHREWTIRAAEAGKHILCEKPLALTAAEAREMAEVCARRGVLLMEAFMYRYTDRVRPVREILRDGRLGEIRVIESSHRFLLNRPDSIKLKPALGGGALYDVGCYPVHFAGMVADLAAGAAPGTVKPAAVSARAVTSQGVDTLFSGILQYPSGALATVGCGFNAQKRIFSTVIGSEGTLEVPDTFLGNAGSLTLIRGDERQEIPVAESDRYRLEVLDFAEAIRQGRPPLLPLQESVRNAEVIDRLRAAAAGG